MHNPVDFSTFVKVYSHHRYLILEYFHHLQKKACTTQQSLPIFPSLPVTTSLFSVSMDLPNLNISYEWNHTISGLLCLASFTQHVFRVYVVACVGTQFLQWDNILLNEQTTCCSYIHALMGFQVISTFFFFLNFWPRKADITLPTKVCLVKAMVFPVVMYGRESWTVKKAEH